MDCGRLGRLAATVVLLVAGGVGPAQAISMAGTGGGTPSPWPTEVISGNGKLKFSHFDSGGVDPHDITLDVLDDGLRFSGPVSRHWPGLEFFHISFKVTALDPSMPIAGGSLLLESHTSRHPFSKVFATKKLLGKGNAFFPELKFLSTYDIQDKIQKPFDEKTFHTPRDVVHVKDTVLLLTSGPATTWVASTNRFPVVPEPGAASLFALGVAGLAVMGRRRRSQRRPSD